jgi:hypothetical protein
MNKFELEAEIFRRMTGRMAPYKDSPAAAGPTDMEARKECWREWRQHFGPFLRAMHATLLEDMT